MRLRPLLLSAAFTVALPFATAQALELSSTSIEDGELNVVHACVDHDGEDQRPQLTITDAPNGTSHYAVIMDDPDAMAIDGVTWVHWAVVNIPVDHTVLDSGAPPPGVELSNSDGVAGYGGMCPEDGTHTYRLAVFALSAPIDTDTDRPPEGLSLEDFRDAYGHLILDEAIIEGAFP